MRPETPSRPNGARNRGTGAPSAFSTARLPARMLLIAASGSSFDRSGWVIVCDPTMWPSAAMRRTISGHASDRRPTQ